MLSSPAPPEPSSSSSNSRSSVRHQKRTVGNILRLYTQRRRDSTILDSTVLTPLKRSMSENANLNRRQQLMKQNETDSELDDDIMMRSPSPSPSPSVKLSTDETCRRDSNASSDSQKSTKKPASLDEIQDLYSALQDLVKTNVTTTPLPERRAKMLKQSPMGSPQPMKRTLTVPEKALRKLSSKLSPSSSFEKDEDSSSNAKHKRGLSVGTLDVVSNIMKRSPFPSRKFSHDVDAKDSKEGKKSSTSKNPNMNSKANKKDRIARHSSNLEQKKGRAAKFLNRLRTKSSAEFSDDNDEGKLSTDEEEITPPTNTNRRLSEADALKIRQRKERGQNSCPTQRKSLQDDTKNEIDQLVASLNLETSNESQHIQTSKASYKDPENELSKLESWFEKAAAEAVLNHHSAKYVVNEQESSSDANQSPNIRNPKSRKKSNNRTRGTAIRRATSNAGSSSRVKEERKARRGKFSSKSFDVGGLSHAKSTPDLSSENDVLNNAGITYKVLGQLNHFTENKLKESSPSENRKSKKISLDGTVGRLPEAPLFYMPGSKESETNNEGGSLKILSQASTDNKTMKCDEGMFYTEKENNAKNLLSPYPNDKAFMRSESVSNAKTSNADFQQINKKMRPKSMFDYFEQDVLIDDADLNTIKNGLTTLDSSQNIQTDNNANFCRAKIINSSHALSLCDLSKTTVVQEKTLWERFRKVASHKKSKPIMA